jgi:hypothetical protein
MEQRGVSRVEVRETLKNGWESGDANPGTEGRRLVFPFDGKWEGTHYAEKEVTVYFKEDNDRLVLLTVVARYGEDFPRGLPI